MAASRIEHVLTVDVGNTFTQFGLFSLSPGEGPVLLGRRSITTPARITADEARSHALRTCDELGAAGAPGAILSCVVPALQASWARGLEQVAAARPLVVGPGLKTGIRMRYDDPSEVGPDRIADAVAALDAYGAPSIVVDLGTTTNLEVIDAQGAFAGGIIAPGIDLGAQSLAQAAARLPMIELRAPKRVIGRSTRAAMQSGVVYGEVARVDGLLDAVCAELGEEARIVVTGEHAGEMAALLRHGTTVDEDLTLRGLALLWQANRR